MSKTPAYLFLLPLLIFTLCIQLSGQTSIAKNGNAWQLMVDGKPFAIKGATFGYDKNVKDYDRYFKDLKFLGVNAIRLWATTENTQTLLDIAHSYGIKVMPGIWMRHGRPGMEDDDHFNYLEDQEGMDVMYNNAIKTVEKYKDHPAVLCWGIGNEVYLNTETVAEKEAYSRLLERICNHIKKLDPNHPIISVEAWTFGLEWWQKYVPSIDIYGLNCYGPGAGLLSSELEKRGIDKPYVITEFGVSGEWDISEEKNGIKVEPNDQQKYEAIVSGYHKWIANKPSCLGVFIFHYSNGSDFISPWFFTHHNSQYRPQYWAIREAYTGEKPLNQVPEIEVFELTDSKTKSGLWIPVALSVSDEEKEELEISFYYNQRTGSRKRRNQINPLNYRGNIVDGFEIQLPAENGAIKVYVNVKDTYGNVGIASTSVLVSDEIAKQRKYLVPKVRLPFYIYKDNEDLPYIPSGYMGNYKALVVDLNYEEEVYSGKTSIKISYNARDNWYGVGFVDPANDWGDILGGYDISGAKTFSFWAKANDTNIKARIGFGLIDKDKPYPDSAKELVDVVLTTKWKKYTIKTKKVDLSCIRSGLVLFSSSNGFSHEIYLDDIVFE
jgi:hypothetical protein